MSVFLDGFGCRLNQSQRWLLAPICPCASPRGDEVRADGGAEA